MELGHGCAASKHERDIATRLRSRSAPQATMSRLHTRAVWPHHGKGISPTSIGEIRNPEKPKLFFRASELVICVGIPSAVHNRWRGRLSGRRAGDERSRVMFLRVPALEFVLVSTFKAKIRKMHFSSRKPKIQASKVGFLLYVPVATISRKCRRGEVVGVRLALLLEK